MEEGKINLGILHEGLQNTVLARVAGIMMKGETAFLDLESEIPTESHNKYIQLDTDMSDFEKALATCALLSEKERDELQSLIEKTPRDDPKFTEYATKITDLNSDVGTCDQMMWRSIRTRVGTTSPINFYIARGFHIYKVEECNCEQCEAERFLKQMIGDVDVTMIEAIPLPEEIGFSRQRQ